MTFLFYKDMCCFLKVAIKKYYPLKRWEQMLCVFLFLSWSFIAEAQELNATIVINKNTERGSQIIKNLENQLRVFINNTKWTNDSYMVFEKINCTFTILINEYKEPGSFNGEIFIQAQRPVFNSSYVSPILIFRDPSFVFEYSEYQPLQLNSNNAENNLVTTLSFYAYLILFLDAESLEPEGGEKHMQQMQYLAQQAISRNWPGWDNNRKGKNSLVDAANDSDFKTFREMWYTYHRRGLDVMADNKISGYDNLLNALPDLKIILTKRSLLPYITLFGETKIKEIISIAQQSDQRQKEATYIILKNIYPTYSHLWEVLR